MEMAQVSGCSISDLEQAEKDCVTALCKLHGFDAECVTTDRIRLREELAVSLGGV